jgi:hypothetical protein
MSMRTPEQYYASETFFEWFMRERDAHKDAHGRVPDRIAIELQYANLQIEEMCRDTFPQDSNMWDGLVANTRRYIRILEATEVRHVSARK